MTHKGIVSCFNEDVLIKYLTEEGEEAVCFSSYYFEKDSIRRSDGLEFPVVPVSAQGIVGAVGPEVTTVGIVDMENFPDPDIYAAIACLLSKGIRVLTLVGGEVDG